MITWNTDVNAPCCPGEIVNDDGRTVLVQTDWDYPGVASTFGWSLSQVQRCRYCGGEPESSDHLHFTCEDCGEQCPVCQHDGTDGTVDCPECRIDAGTFIAAAGEFLDGADGAVAEDPGYFGLED